LLSYARGRLHLRKEESTTPPSISRREKFVWWGAPFFRGHYHAGNENLSFTFRIEKRGENLLKVLPVKSGKKKKPIISKKSLTERAKEKWKGEYFGE